MRQISNCKFIMGSEYWTCSELKLANAVELSNGAQYSSIQVVFHESTFFLFPFLRDFSLWLDRLSVDRAPTLGAALLFAQWIYLCWINCMYLLSWPLERLPFRQFQPLFDCLFEIWNETYNTKWNILGKIKAIVYHLPH